VKMFIGRRRRVLKPGAYRFVRSRGGTAWKEDGR